MRHFAVGTLGLISLPVSPQGTTSDFGNINKNLWYSTVIGGSIKLITLCSYAPFEKGTLLLARSPHACASS